MSWFTGASDALEAEIIKREVDKRQAMIDAIAVKDRESVIQDRGRQAQQQAAQLALQREQEARIAAAQKEAQENLEKEREYRRAQNTATTILPGQMDEATAALLEKHGLAGGIVRRAEAGPSVQLVGERIAPAAAEGDIPLLDRPAISRAVTPERVDSLGGVNFQNARTAAAERAAQAEAAQGAAAERAREAAASRAEQAEANRDMRRALAEVAASNRQTLSAPQQATITKGLRNDFMRESKDFITTAKSYRELEGTLSRADAAGDMAAIFQFMKSLDPTSVVREGEFANAQNSAGVPDRVRNYYNQLQRGTRLNPQQRAEFLDVSRGIYESGLTAHQQRIAEYTADAQAFGIDPQRVIRDVTTGVPQSGGGNAPAGSTVEEWVRDSSGRLVKK